MVSSPGKKNLPNPMGLSSAGSWVIAPEAKVGKDGFFQHLSEANRFLWRKKCPPQVKNHSFWILKNHRFWNPKKCDCQLNAGVCVCVFFFNAHVLNQKPGSLNRSAADLDSYQVLMLQEWMWIFISWGGLLIRWLGYNGFFYAFVTKNLIKPTNIIET